MQPWNQYGEAYDFPAFMGLPKTYLLATTPRCGSHFLGHLLRNTGQLGSPLEYFSRGRIADWAERLDTQDLPQLFRQILRIRTSPNGWFGVKAHWPQFARILRHPELMDLLNFQQHVYMTRRDRVAQAVSWVIAQQTSAWISFQAPRAEPTYSSSAIANALQAIHAEHAEWSRFYEQHGIEPLNMVYEDVVKEPAEAVSSVLRFCGLQPAHSLRPGVIEPLRQATELNAVWVERFKRERGDPLNLGDEPTPFPKPPS